MTLLEECIDVLSNCLILEKAEKAAIETEFYSLVNLTKWGRVDWGEDINKVTISDAGEIMDICTNSQYYIIWSDIETPIIKCELNRILKYIDDVTAVSFDTWLLSADKKFLIEFYHESEITIGILERSSNNKIW